MAIDRYQFSDVEMEFLPSLGIERALQISVDKKITSLAVVAKGRHFDAVAEIYDRLAEDDLRFQSLTISSFQEVVQHVPAETSKKSQEFAETNRVDGIIAIGGGSAIGTAKVMALAFDKRRSIVAIPTTFSGSEMTSIYGITTGGRKETFKDERVMASSVIYDNSLFQSLPLEIAVPSIANALAHGAEALWGPNKSRTASLLALGGIEAITTGAKQVAVDLLDQSDAHLTDIALDQLTYGAALSGVAFGATGSGLHHKICHLIGGTYGLDHANTHMIVGLQLLPAMAEAFAPADSKLVLESIRSISSLVDVLDLPRNLREIGLDPSCGDDLISSIERLSDGISPTIDRRRLRAVMMAAIG